MHVKHQCPILIDLEYMFRDHLEYVRNTLMCFITSHPYSILNFYSLYKLDLNINLFLIIFNL